jgi:hypothetical protein
MIPPMSTRATDSLRFALCLGVALALLVVFILSLH